VNEDRKVRLHTPARRGLGIAGVIAFALAAAPLATRAAEPADKPAPPASKTGAKKKPPPSPTLQELLRLLEQQRALIENQQELINAQQARIAEQETKLQSQDQAIEEQKAKLAEMEQRLAAMNQQLEELQKAIPGMVQQKALEERLKRIEEEAAKVPELPPDVVAAGDFPGSIRIPGTDTAIKFGGRIRTAGVFTLDSLGSDDRFLTNSIPVEPDDEAAGKGKRTSFTANTSRLNFEVRTPAGASQMRAFIEGDFFAPDGNGNRTAFRLRHAYAQFHGILVGQTWSTFSDPAADHQDLDFEGINGENVIRQPQFRYTWVMGKTFNMAVAAETPEVSLTGGQGVNFVPDLVGRAVWKFKDIGHLQGAVVLRQIRGEQDPVPPSTTAPGGVSSVNAWGASVSGVVPFFYFHLTDRFIYQLNVGKGNARYINDLNSLGGQDAVFNPATGELKALPARGFYVDYEHQWKEWQRTREMKLRSSFIWSYVDVGNLDFQLDTAYHRTSRESVNVVLSPIDRIDVGVEYIFGTRENKDGHKGSADQFQIVGIFRF
jgi:outer membrane DcaP-like protein